MENNFKVLAISQPEYYNMAKRPNWDTHPYTPFPIGDSAGEPSAYGRSNKLFARDDPRQPIRDQPLTISQQTPSRTTSPLGNFESCDYYTEEHYLPTVLFDFGLQLSPGGTHIEHDPTHSSFDDNKLESEQERNSDKERASISSASPPPRDNDFEEHRVKATTLPHSKFRKITQFSRSSQEKDEGIHTDIHHQIPKLEPLPENQPHQKQQKKKVKKYECQQQLEDPEEERKRLNAINARRNRMKQKELTQSLKKRAKTLEDVNQKCGLVLKRLDGDAWKLRQQLEESNKEKALLEKSLKEKESEIREQREKFALFRGHLDLIASSLDEDNPSKKLITNLLKKLPGSSYSLSD
ncbi:uncharacterized protein [Palaemon carinicauda]|uniref:uncharacterized protein n=1 Tax=Palaemon carinicauda TaxID=392227 RepID=UPI0035B60BAB